MVSTTEPSSTISLRSIEGLMSLSFLGLGIWAFGNGYHDEMTDWIWIWHKNRAGINSKRIDCGFIGSSVEHACVLTTFDWDLERIDGRHGTKTMQDRFSLREKDGVIVISRPAQHLRYTAPHVRSFESVRDFLRVGMEFDRILGKRLGMIGRGEEGCSSSHYILAQQHCKTNLLSFLIMWRGVVRERLNTAAQRNGMGCWVYSDAA